MGHDFIVQENTFSKIIFASLFNLQLTIIQKFYIQEEKIFYAHAFVLYIYFLLVSNLF